MSSDFDSGPNLLLDWYESKEGPRFLRAGIGSILVHAVLVGFAFLIGSLDISPPTSTTVIVADLRKATPLYAPPTQLTQKQPNRNKVAKEVDVEGLTAPPTPKPAPPPVRTFQPPTPPRPVPGPPLAAQLNEPPKIDAGSNTPAALPPAGTPKAPPPQIQSEEKPKLAFETPGQHTPTSSAASKIVPPKTSVEDAIHAVARGGGQGGLVVEDSEPPNIPGTFRTAPSPAAAHGQLELLSDPMGVDFKPYLIRILALVRQNWYAVIPESARLGNRGVVQLQFVISHNGQVPKLVIAMPSGSESLDRAAVAGISASVPFPPLPQEFKGREIRLQFAFKYNVR